MVVVEESLRKVTFYCSPTSTTVVLTLISAVVYSLLPLSHNFLIALTHTLGNFSIRLRSLFKFDRANSFKLWDLFVMCKSPSVRHCYSPRKIFAVEMQQKFLLSDWESLLICNCWMRSSHMQDLSLFIEHKISIIFMLDPNVFAYEISLQSDNFFLLRCFWCLLLLL